MAKVSNEKIDLIKSKINIVDIISQYLKLEKKGRNYLAICPFHQDSNPSMNINVEKQIYRCFSCSAGGNVFTFLQEFKKISFLEALREVAKIADVDLSELNQKFSESDVRLAKQQKYFEINRVAANYYANNLLLEQSKKAQEYLNKRMIDENLVAKFEIGYAGGGDEIIKILDKKGFEIKIVEECGLVSTNYRITPYFHNRIIFPIKDENGQIIGFSGRLLADDAKQMKYMNTPETVVFKKQEIMYNLDQAKNFIRQSGAIILLEGYMDVIALTKVGINNAVAIMGTNLSSYHLQKIKNLARIVYLFLDGDSPGVQAMIKASVLLLKNNIVVKIVDNDTPNDPDELVNQGKGELIKSMIESALHPVSYLLKYLEKKCDLKKPEFLKEAIKQLETLLISISDTIERNLYLNEICTKLGVDKEALAKQLNINTSESTTFNYGESIPAPLNFNETNYPEYEYNETFNENYEEFATENFQEAPMRDKMQRVFNHDRFYNCECNTILMMLASRKASDYFVSNIGYLNFGDFRLVANYIVQYYKDNQSIDSINISKLSEVINDQRLIGIVREIYEGSIISHQYREKALQDYAKLINDFASIQDLEMLRSKQAKAKDINEKISLGLNMEKIAKKIKKISGGN